MVEFPVTEACVIKCKHYTSIVELYCVCRMPYWRADRTKDGTVWELQMMVSSQVSKNNRCCIFSWKTTVLFILQIVKISFVIHLVVGTTSLWQHFLRAFTSTIMKKCLWLKQFLKASFYRKMFLRFQLWHGGFLQSYLIYT